MVHESWYFCYLAIVCPPSQRLSNAQIDTHLAIWGTNVTYTCLPGYRLPNVTYYQMQQTIQCLVTGLWNITVIECQGWYSIQIMGLLWMIANVPNFVNIVTSIVYYGYNIVWQYPQRTEICKFSHTSYYKSLYIHVRKYMLLSSSHLRFMRLVYYYITKILKNRGYYHPERTRRW